MIPKKPEHPWGKVRDKHGLVARSAIRQVVHQIVECFQPDKVILFGSYAYGQPRPESDVDILIVMRARNEIDQSLRIEETIDPPFSLDAIVRTPRNLQWRLREGDWFLREVMGRGEVLYEKLDERVDTESRSRLGRRRQNSSGETASP